MDDGEADEYSDIEAYLYVKDHQLENFDGRAFVEQIAPLKLGYINMYGILAVIFDDLMRGEFILYSQHGHLGDRDLARLVHLPDPSAAILLDRSGRLAEATACLRQPCRPDPAKTSQQISYELANWTLSLAQILARGEVARAHALMQTTIAPQQLQLCRLLRGTTDHWLTPSRSLERDLPAADQTRYAATTARLDKADVHRAAAESWKWSRQLIDEAAARWRIAVFPVLYDKISLLLATQSTSEG